MSFTAIDWAAAQNTGSPLRQLVLVLLANHADGDNYCWPGVDRIAVQAQVTVRTVQRALRWLEDHDLIRVEPRYRRNGSQASNGYLLNVTPPNRTPAVNVPVDQAVRNPVDNRPAAAPTVTVPVSSVSPLESPLEPSTAEVVSRLQVVDERIVWSFLGRAAGPVRDPRRYVDACVANYRRDHGCDPPVPVGGAAEPASAFVSSGIGRW